MSKEYGKECSSQSEKVLRCNDEMGTFKRNAEIEKDVAGADVSHEAYSYNEGHFFVQNLTGQTLKKLYVRHRIGNHESSMNEHARFENVEYWDSTKGTKFRYQTGFATPYDYWYIEIELENGYVYATKDDFYCSVSSNDNGLAFITIHEDLQARFIFSSSSGCRVHLRGPK